jgi:hypothetical protein
MSPTTRESQPPIAVGDIRDCGQLMAFRRPDGRVVVRRQPCDWKGCASCGPRLRQRLAVQWGHAMGREVIYRKVTDDDKEPARLRRRKVMAGQELAHIPLPDGRRALYTTVAIEGASVCEDVPFALSRDFSKMVLGDRRRFLSERWRQVVADAEVEAKAKREAWEWLGRVSEPLEKVEEVARDLGKFVGRTDDMVIVETMELQHLVGFLRRIDCRGPWEEWMNPRARAA